MPKNFLNPYRLRKKIKRGLKKNSLFATDKTAGLPSGKDFAWKKSHNPFRRTTINWRRRIYGALAIFFTIATGGVGFFHPFFQIKSLDGAGLNRIEKTEFEQSINGIIDYKKFFILPGRSYFLVNTKEVEQILKEKYPLNSVTITKKFPDSLLYEVEEKISTIIYDNGREYSYIGLDGKLVEKILNVQEGEWYEIKETVTSTNERGEEVSEERVKERFHVPNVDTIKAQMGDYPIIFDSRAQSAEVNQTVLNPETVKTTILWFNYLQKRAGVPFAYLVLENELRDATIETGEGWRIHINLGSEIEAQVERLDFLLREKIHRKNLEYIDLRYGEKVYWK